MQQLYGKNWRLSAYVACVLSVFVVLASIFWQANWDTLAYVAAVKQNAIVDPVLLHQWVYTQAERVFSDDHLKELLEKDSY